MEASAEVAKKRAPHHQVTRHHGTYAAGMPHLLLRVAPVLETHLAVVHPGRDRRRGPELPAEPRADGAVVGRGQGVGGRREAPPGAEGGAAVLWTSFFARSGERGVC